MMHLACPWCGYRNVSEFAYEGELVKRPDPATTTPQEWRSYLYLRANTAGQMEEGWYHRAGCRRYFEAVRDTTNNTVLETRRPGHGSTVEGSNTQASDISQTTEGASV